MPLSWIALNSVKGLGPVRIKHLLERYKTPEAVFRQNSSELTRFPGISAEICTALRDPALFAQAEEQLQRAEQMHVKVLTLRSSEYPPILKEIFAPPPVLYVKGDTEVFKRHAVAVVGTRNPTQYGKDAAKLVVGKLADRNIAIISGLAIGIDTVAHRTCLERGGYTVAVLGCGIDTVYPSVNVSLAQQIERHGAIVSEFPMGTPPESFNFPRRNRIISGLSAAVVVVEAGEKSGSLITASYALQQNRDIFAVPGSIFSSMSIGANNLIKSGAVPVRTGDEIVESLEVVSNPGLTRCEHGPTPPFAVELLSEDERQIYEAITSSPQRLDQLTEKTGKTVPALFNALLNLELKGMVKQLAGQQFTRF